MFKSGQLVQWCGMHLVVTSVGNNTITGEQVLSLQFPCVLDAPIIQQGMIPSNIVCASEIDCLIGNNYQSKTNASAH